MTKQIRTFDSGATRDTNVNKPSYVKALSPIALQYYVDYLGRHRLQSDGDLRDWDNWKNGIPQDVYLDGQGRHFWAVWLLCHGFPASDNHGPVTLKDSLCGVIFNAQGMLHELLKEEKQEKFVCPEGWVVALNRNTDDSGIRDCGWFVCKKSPRTTFPYPYDEYLHKGGTLHARGGTGKEPYYGFGEAPGYWPTKEAAETALQQYLEKTK